MHSRTFYVNSRGEVLLVESDYSLLCPEFDLGSGHMAFVVNEVALEAYFLLELWFW